MCKSEEATRQFGTTALDNVYGISVDASGNVVVSGLTSGSFPGQATIVAPYDGFVQRYSSAGTATFTRQLGSTGNDGLYGVGVDSMGGIYAVGAATGSFPGFTVGGSQDAAIIKLVP